MTKKFSIALLTGIFVFGVAGVSSATILTFDDLQGYVWAPLDQNYGDNVNSLTDGVGSYLEGNGFTDRISVSYNTVGAGQYMEAWDVGFGDLTNVAYGNVNQAITEITLTAEAGFKVTLNSFDLASYNQDVRLATTLEVVDSLGGVVWSAGDLNILGGPQHSSFLPSFADTSLTIRWGSDWNIGIDNINFDQSSSTAPVPEPATMLLFGTGLLGIVGKRLKRKKK